MSDFWNSRPVLVTGAAGFIGSHLAERLVREGARVAVFLHYNARANRGNLEFINPDIIENINVFFGDLRDPFSVHSIVEGNDVVFHLGALISIPYSYQAPADYVATNVQGTLNVLQAARAAGVGRVIHTSTSEVYGTAETVPIDERHRLYAQSPYAASKLGADQLAQSFHLSFGLPVATLRPFNCYGPRQSARALVPAIISQVLFRDRLVLGSLEPKRDLTFVEDTVDAFVRIAEREDAIGQVLNAGSGIAVSVGELVERILALIGEQRDVIQDDARVRPSNSEVGLLLSDPRRALDVLGWRPQIDLDEGLRRTIEWIRKHEDQFRPREYVV